VQVGKFDPFASRVCLECMITLSLNPMICIVVKALLALKITLVEVGDDLPDYCAQ